MSVFIFVLISSAILSFSRKQRLCDDPFFALLSRNEEKYSLLMQKAAVYDFMSWTIARKLSVFLNNRSRESKFFSSKI